MKISVIDLAEQIKLALKDVFEAKVEQSEQNVTLVFENGQTFLLKVSEN